MSWAYENSKKGYVSEASCPLCGYPVGAIYWDDGTVGLDECYACKLKREKEKTLESFSSEISKN